MTENDETKKITAPSGPRRAPAPKTDLRVAAGPREKSVVNIRDYISLFFKHKKTILISFFTIIVLSAIYPLFVYKPKFEARSVLLVKFGWENFTPDLTPENRQLPDANPAEIVQSEVSILKSRELKERVVNTLKPENIFPELSGKSYGGLTNAEAAMFLIDKDLRITSEKGNNIMVTFSGDNPERAGTLVNQLVDTYIERRGEIFKDPKSILFLEKKAEEYARKLADTESRMKTFRAETNIVAIEEQRASLLKEQYDLGRARVTAEDEAKGEKEKVAELERQMASIPKFSQTSETALSFRLRGTEQKILDLQLLERELSARYKDGNKFLIGARERLKIARDFLEKQRQIKPAEVVDPVWKELQRRQFTSQADLMSASAKVASIDEMLADLNAEILKLDAMEQRDKALHREIADNQEKYRNYRHRAEEAKILEELNRQKMSSVSVIERASPSKMPTNPFRFLLVFIPVVLSAAVLGSLGIAYLIEILGQGLSTPTEAEKRLNLPVLASIPVK